MAPAVQKWRLVLISNELFDFIVLGYKNTGVDASVSSITNDSCLQHGCCICLSAAFPQLSSVGWFALIYNPGFLLQSTYTDLSGVFCFVFFSSLDSNKLFCAVNGQLFYFLLFFVLLFFKCLFTFFSVSYFFPLVLFLFL